MIRISIAVILVGLVADTACGQPVVVAPEETDEILANPGMGWQTFHRTKTHDKNLPSWIPSTVHYARWGWGTLEPQPGEIDGAFLDGILKETREAGQTLAFRVMCNSTYPRQPYHPKWLTEIGGKVVTTRYGSGPELEVPVLDDPPTLAAHLDFIRRLGNRYDGHPDIEHIDLGTVGWWGEWHMSQSSNAPMPALETQKKIVDAYLAAFKKTPLVMLIGGGEMRHGFPAANTSAGMSLVTTLPAPMTVFEPIVTPGQMMAPPPTQTSQPIWIGRPNSWVRRSLAFIGWLAA